MAKLSAHGGVVVLKMEKGPYEKVSQFWQAPNGEPETYQEKVQVALVLLPSRKYKVMLKRYATITDRYKPQGFYWHNWGWHKDGILKAGVSVEKFKQTLLDKGWRVI